MIIIYTMRETVIMRKPEDDKPPRIPRGRTIFADVLATTALAATLASCWGELNEIKFDSKHNSVKTSFKFVWREYVDCDMEIGKENDSTFYWLVDGGLFKSKKFTWNTPEEVFEQVTDEVCSKVSEAQLSSREHIYDLEAKAQDKIKYIQREYRKMLDENDWAVKDSTIVYKP